MVMFFIIYFLVFSSLRKELGLVRWLMPIIPILWDAKADGSLEVRSLRAAC